MTKAILFIASIVISVSALASAPTIETCQYLQGSIVYTTVSSEFSTAATKQVSFAACRKHGANCAFEGCSVRPVPAGRSVKKATVTYTDRLKITTPSVPRATSGAPAGDCNRSPYDDGYIYDQAECDSMQSAVEATEEARQEDLAREAAGEDSLSITERYNERMQREQERNARDTEHQLEEMRRAQGAPHGGPGGGDTHVGEARGNEMHGRGPGHH